MKEQKDKMVENLIANELMKEIGIDEERMLSRIEFTEKEVKPFYKKIKFLIPTLSCALLIIMALVSLLSITVYKSVNESVYNDNDIVYIALEEFEEEVEGFSKLVRMNLYQINKELVCGLFYNNLNKNYYVVLYQKNIERLELDLSFNGVNLSIKSKVSIFNVELQQSNELIVYDNNEEIFKTNFKF